MLNTFESKKSRQKVFLGGFVLGLLVAGLVAGSVAVLFSYWEKQDAEIMAPAYQIDAMGQVYQLK